MKLENTRAVLSKLGYSPQGIEYMIREIGKVLAKYSDPDKAARILDENFSKNVHSRFGEHNFRRFIKDIDPRNRESVNMAEIGKEAMENMTPAAIQAWNEACNAPDLNHLIDVWLYEELCSQHFRVSKKDQVDPKCLPTARFISVPIGGKPRKR